MRTEYIYIYIFFLAQEERKGKGGERPKKYKDSIKEMKKKCGGITGYDTSKTSRW